MSRILLVLLLLATLTACNPLEKCKAQYSPDGGVRLECQP